MLRVSFHNERFLHSMFLGKRHVNIIYICVLSLFIVLTLWSLSSRLGFAHLLVSDQEADATTSLSSPSPRPLELPDDYQYREAQSPLCAHRLGLGYLEDLHHSRAIYCSEQSKSQLTCFHSQTNKSGRIDFFCIGQGARLNGTRTSFQTSCHLDEPWGIETNESSVPLALFPKYLYKTGPSNIIDKFVNRAVEDLELPSHKKSEKFTGLLKHKGARNPWHSLMEIISLSMTFEIL